MSIEFTLLLLTALGVYITFKVQANRFQEALKIIQEANLMGKHLMLVGSESVWHGRTSTHYSIFNYQDEQYTIEVQIPESGVDIIVLTPRVLATAAGLRIKKNGENVFQRWQR